MKNIVKPITLSLFMAVVVMCLAVLSILSLSQSGADKKIAEKFSNSVKLDYILESKAQEWLKDFDSQIQNGLIKEEEVSKIIGNIDEKHIDIKLAVDTENKAYRVLQWAIKPPAVEETTLDDIWNGK